MIIRNSASNSFVCALQTIYQEKIVTMGSPTKNQKKKKKASETWVPAL